MQSLPRLSVGLPVFRRFRLLASMLSFCAVTFVHCAQTAEDIDTSFAYDSPVSPRSD